MVTLAFGTCAINSLCTCAWAKPFPKIVPMVKLDIYNFALKNALQQNFGYFPWSYIFVVWLYNSGRYNSEFHTLFSKMEDWVVYFLQWNWGKRYICQTSSNCTKTGQWFPIRMGQLFIMNIIIVIRRCSICTKNRNYEDCSNIMNVNYLYVK